MTIKIMPSDWGDMLNDLFRRVANLEQSVSNPSIIHQNNFETITLGPSGDTVTIVAPQLAATSLVTAVGAFYNVIYMDVSWTAPTDGAAVEYEVEIAKKVGGIYDLKQTRRTISTSVRISNLEPNTVYGVRVFALNRIGRYSTPLPAIGYTDVTTGQDSTTPASVANVQLVRGATSAVVKFDPSTDPDVALANGLYEVQLSDSNTFTVVQRQVTTTAWVVAFNDLTTEGTYYARVRAIDASGNQSAWSAVTPGVLAGGVNNSMIIADLSAAKITFGTMSGDRITTNTLDANAIKTSSITASDITLAGGQFKAGSPPTTGMVINSQGLRLYAGGSVTVALDAATGTGSFTGTISGSTITGGTIQTATSGARIRLITTPQLEFYSGHASEVEPGKILGVGTYPGGSFPTLQIWSPKDQVGGLSSAIHMPAGGYMSINAISALDIRSAQSYLWLQGSTSATVHSDGGVTLQANQAGVGSLLQMWRSAGVNYFDISRGRVRVWDQTELGTLYAANTDVWGLTADNISCWAVDAQGIVACNDRDFRLRAMNDSNHRIWYNSGIDGVEVYGNNRVRLASGGAARLDAGNGGIYFYIVPGGSDADTILRIAGSSQVLKHNSTIRAKQDVKDLKKSGENNPLWQMRPVSFKWKNRPVEELERLDRLRPGGRSVGFIAEEMHEISPDTVTFDAEDRPEGINESGLLAYIVAGVQHLKRQVDGLKAQVKELTQQSPNSNEEETDGDPGKHGSSTAEDDDEGGSAGE